MTAIESPAQEFAPASTVELARFVRENAEGSRGALYPVGGRTALPCLGPRDRTGTLISTARLSRLIDYPARDMTITVEAGMRIDELAALLAAEKQQLPLDITHAHRATLGGAIACNVSGPRRYGFGTFRDYVIGISAVDAAGHAFKAGGRVVKNVAGYDLCKLLVGSRGTLGIITQVTLKVKPAGETADALWCACRSYGEIDQILDRLLLSETRPVAVEACTSIAARDLVADSRMSFPADRPVLIVAFEGAVDEVRWQIGRLRQELQPLAIDEMEETGAETAALLLATLRDYPDGGDAALTFQANLRPSQTPAFLERCETLEISATAHAGNGIVVAHLADELAKETALRVIGELTELARAGDGNLSILQADPAWRGDFAWWGRSEPGWPLMRKVKDALDSHGLLNPGAIPF